MSGAASAASSRHIQAQAVDADVEALQARFLGDFALPLRRAWLHAVLSAAYAQHSGVTSPTREVLAEVVWGAFLHSSLGESLDPPSSSSAGGLLPVLATGRSPPATAFVSGIAWTELAAAPEEVAISLQAQLDDVDDIFEKRKPLERRVVSLPADDAAAAAGAAADADADTGADADDARIYGDAVRAEQGGQSTRHADTHIVHTIEDDDEDFDMTDFGSDYLDDEPLTSTTAAAASHAGGHAAAGGVRREVMGPPAIIPRHGNEQSLHTGTNGSGSASAGASANTGNAAKAGGAGERPAKKMSRVALRDAAGNLCYGIEAAPLVSTTSSSVGGRVHGGRTSSLSGSGGGGGGRIPEQPVPLDATTTPSAKLLLCNVPLSHGMLILRPWRSLAGWDIDLDGALPQSLLTHTHTAAAAGGGGAAGGGLLSGSGVFFFTSTHPPRATAASFAAAVAGVVAIASNGSNSTGTAGADVNDPIAILKARLLNRRAALPTPPVPDTGVPFVEPPICNSRSRNHGGGGSNAGDDDSAGDGGGGGASRGSYRGASTRGGARGRARGTSTGASRGRAAYRGARGGRSRGGGRARSSSRGRGRGTT